MSSQEEETLLRFWSRYQNKDQTDVFNWLKALTDQELIVFLLFESESEQCVGCLMTIPRQLIIDGNEYKVGIAGIFIVDEKHRTLLPALKLTKEVKALVDSGEFDLIYGLPNKNAAGVFRRAGFKKLGPFVRASKLLSISARLNTTALKHRIGKPFVALFDFARLIFYPSTWHRTPAGFHGKVLSNLDERLDSLLQRTKAKYSIIADRSSDYLQCRYNLYPAADISIFCLIDSINNEIAGYIAYRDKCGYISIREAFFPDNPKLRQSLFYNFVRHIQPLRSKSILVDFLDSEEIVNILSGYGFSISPLNRDVIYVANDHLLENHPTVEDYRNWLLFSGDMDP
jgi:hypothetical protein